MKEKLVYYENLDGLRAIAALMVVLFHFFIFPITSYIQTDVYSKFTEFGKHGVSLFFVLSGFVITRILINNKSDQNYFKSFYWRRVKRILPLYYLFLLVWYYVAPFLLDGQLAKIEPVTLQLPYFFYIQNFDWLTGFAQSGPNHYWSLAVEEHFYLLWPLIVYLLPVKYLKNLIFLIIIIIIPLKFIFLSNGISINNNTFTRFDQILLGALLAYFEFTGDLKARPGYFKKVFVIILVTIIPLGFLTYLGQRFIPDLKEISKYNLLGLVFFSIIGISLVCSKTCLYNKVLMTKVLQYLGKISYGIYVWHLLILILVNRYIKTEIMIIDLLSCIFFTVLISHISFFYFEKKILDSHSRLANPRTMTHS